MISMQKNTVANTDLSNNTIMIIQADSGPENALFCIFTALNCVSLHKAVVLCISVYCSLHQACIHCTHLALQLVDCRDLFQAKKCHEVSHARLHREKLPPSSDDLYHQLSWSGSS